MRPQKASHIGLFDAKFIFGVTAPVSIRSKKTPWVAQIAIHSRPKCRIYSNAAGARPGRAYYSKCYFTFLRHQCQAQLCKIRRVFGEFFVTVAEGMKFCRSIPSPGGRVARRAGRGIRAETRKSVRPNRPPSRVTPKTTPWWRASRFRNQNAAARIPHQPPIGSEEPMGDSFPPGEAMGAAAPDGLSA